ncbi:LORF2 protein, partial [Crocuta crocuta]
QNQTPVRYQYTPMRMSKIFKTDPTRCWQGCDTTGNPVHCRGCGRVRGLQALWKAVWAFLKVKRTPNPRFCHSQGFQQEKGKQHISTRTCTQTSTVALAEMVRNWKEHKHLSTDAKISKQ